MPHTLFNPAQPHDSAGFGHVIQLRAFVVGHERLNSYDE